MDLKYEHTLVKACETQKGPGASRVPFVFEGQRAKGAPRTSAGDLSTREALERGDRGESDLGTVELELAVIVFAVVGGLEMIGRSGAFVSVDAAGEFAEIRFALKGPGAVGGLRLHF